MLYLDDHVRMVDTTTTLTCDARLVLRGRRPARAVGQRGDQRPRRHAHAPSRHVRPAARAAPISTAAWRPGQQPEDHRSTTIAYLARLSIVLQARGHVSGRGRREQDRRCQRDVRSTTTGCRHEAVGTRQPGAAQSRRRGQPVAEIRAHHAARSTPRPRIAEAIDSVRVEPRHACRRTADYAAVRRRAPSAAGCYGNPRAWDNETDGDRRHARDRGPRSARCAASWCATTR